MTDPGPEARPRLCTALTKEEVSEYTMKKYGVVLFLHRDLGLWDKAWAW